MEKRITYVLWCLTIGLCLACLFLFGVIIGWHNCENYLVIETQKNSRGEGENTSITWLAKGIYDDAFNEGYGAGISDQGNEPERTNPYNEVLDSED